MAKTLPLLLVLLLAFAILAGCTGEGGDGGDGATPTPATGATPTTTTPAATTPATATPVTTPPVTTTPTTPTPPTTPAEENATIERVVVLSAPDRVAPGERAEVCWRVEGRGTIPHTALHYDTQSHPDATAFTAYAGGAAYPGGGATSPTVQLPGVFCADLTAPADGGALFYRAHALRPPELPGVLSVEKRLDAGEPAGVHFVGDLPEAAPPNTNVTLCWRVAGATGTVPHTAIHHDTESHPDAASFAAYAGGAAYPGNQTTATGNYSLADAFCTNVKTPASGALWLRAHVMGGDFPAPGNLSAERSVVVAPRVNVVGPLPETAEAGSRVNVCWRVEGEGVSPHTALHFDTQSHPNATGFADYAGGAAYPGNTPSATGGYALPGPFCADLTMPASGTLYFRAHGVYPGVGLPGELGAEHAIRVA